MRTAYKHLACGTVTTMGLALSETYARDSAFYGFYGGTFCVGCGKHFRLVDENGQRTFLWTDDGEGVGT